jgi:hypothetical protein
MSMTAQELARLLSNIDALTISSWNEDSAGIQTLYVPLVINIHFLDPANLPLYMTQNPHQYLPNQFGAGYNTITGFNQTQQDAARDAFLQWNQVADVAAFVVGPAAAGANTITFGFLPFNNPSAAAYEAFTAVPARNISSNHPNN